MLDSNPDWGVVMANDVCMYEWLNKFIPLEFLFWPLRRLTKPQVYANKPHVRAFFKANLINSNGLAQDSAIDGMVPVTTSKPGPRLLLQSQSVCQSVRHSSFAYSIQKLPTLSGIWFFPDYPWILNILNGFSLPFLSCIKGKPFEFSSFVVFLID